MLSPKRQEEMISSYFTGFFLDCSQSEISQYRRNLIRRLQARSEVTSPKEGKPHSPRPLPGVGHAAPRRGLGEHC